MSILSSLPKTEPGPHGGFLACVVHQHRLGDRLATYCQVIQHEFDSEEAALDAARDVIDRATITEKPLH